MSGLPGSKAPRLSGTNSLGYSGIKTCGCPYGIFDPLRNPRLSPVDGSFQTTQSPVRHKWMCMMAIPRRKGCTLAQEELDRNGYRLSDPLSIYVKCKPSHGALFRRWYDPSLAIATTATTATIETKLSIHGDNTECHVTIPRTKESNRLEF